MKTKQAPPSTIVIPPRTVAGRTIEVSPVAVAAINLAAECAGEIDRARDKLSELAEKRADAIRTALDTGMRQADVARALGISGQAVYNILSQH